MMVIADPESRNGITYKPKVVISPPETTEKSVLRVKLGLNDDEKIGDLPTPSTRGILLTPLWDAEYPSTDWK